jgi:hypothetical protein
MSLSPSTSEAVCAACSTRGTGRFCSNCGASLEAAVCAGCSVSLSPGARFCHSCGLPAGASRPGVSVPATSSRASSLPWVVAAIALVSLLAFLAGKGFSARQGSGPDAPQNSLSQVGGDGGAQGAIRGPDISQLSPEESADRLFNRVMLLDGKGKTDSVLFFAPMAISAYQMLDPLNTAQRYELGRIAEVAGALPLAKAQADTILRESRTNLLGLLLASRIAAVENRPAERSAYDTRLLAAYPAEAAKKLSEYQRHDADIVTALADARRQGAR